MVREGFVPKHCPRCGGNMYLEKDHEEWYERCLMCGYYRVLRVLVTAEKGAGASESGEAGVSTKDNLTEKRKKVPARK
ncbi:MAG: hypothetical protein ABIH70_06475 [Chloroflexota bacterium]